MKDFMLCLGSTIPNIGLILMQQDGIFGMILHKFSILIMGSWLLNLIKKQLNIIGSTIIRFGVMKVSIMDVYFINRIGHQHLLMKN